MIQNNQQEILVPLVQKPIENNYEMETAQTSASNGFSNKRSPRIQEDKQNVLNNYFIQKQNNFFLKKTNKNQFDDIHEEDEFIYQDRKELDNSLNDNKSQSKLSQNSDRSDKYNSKIYQIIKEQQESLANIATRNNNQQSSEQRSVSPIYIQINNKCLVKQNTQIQKQYINQGNQNNKFIQKKLPTGVIKLNPLQNNQNPISNL